jgi:hypothetical protein
MAFSPFDKRLLDDGLAFFTRPRLASLLEQLGATEGERVDALATMLRHSSPEEFDEAVAIFQRALARVTRAQERSRDGERDGIEGDESRRRRYSASAERREQRRRSA